MCLSASDCRSFNVGNKDFFLLADIVITGTGAVTDIEVFQTLQMVAGLV